jgi:1-acyl-sn-glycerol-3-phosphate acyltransferase
LDPLLLIAAADRPLRFIIAREQYVRPCLHWLFRAVGCIPVDRKGRPERALREALAALRAGEVIAIFPHGRIQLPGDENRPIKGGAVRLAMLAGCPVVPARIDGVRGEGLVVRAVFLRSRARVEPLPVISVQGDDFRSLVRQLGALLGSNP